MKQLITIVVIVIILSLISITLIKTDHSEIEVLKKNNLALQTRIDSLSHINDSIGVVLTYNNNEIDRLYIQQSKLFESLEDNTDKIIKLKKEYEKDNRIDTFKSADIIRYFSNF